LEVKEPYFSPKIGKGKYVLAEYEKIKFISVPLGDKPLVYVIRTIVKSCQDYS
jgi:hypothetical protein